MSQSLHVDLHLTKDAPTSAPCAWSDLHLYAPFGRRPLGSLSTPSARDTLPICLEGAAVPGTLPRESNGNSDTESSIRRAGHETPKLALDVDREYEADFPGLNATRQRRVACPLARERRFHNMAACRLLAWKQEEDLSPRQRPFSSVVIISLPAPALTFSH
jgi:hypothetical protein